MQDKSLLCWRMCNQFKIPVGRDGHGTMSNAISTIRLNNNGLEYINGSGTSDSQPSFSLTLSPAAPFLALYQPWNGFGGKWAR